MKESEILLRLTGASLKSPITPKVKDSNIIFKKS